MLRKTAFVGGGEEGPTDRHECEVGFYQWWAVAGIRQGDVVEVDPFEDSGASIGKGLVPDQRHRVQSPR